MKNFKGVEFVLFWSEEDNCFIADVGNDFIGTFKTHGDSLEEALKNAKEVLELAFEDETGTPQEILKKMHPHKVVFIEGKDERPTRQCNSRQSDDNDSKDV